MKPLPSKLSILALAVCSGLFASAALQASGLPV